jgi:4-diphosphocytidyl-2-C-methyl-D-erythritol kinase
MIDALVDLPAPAKLNLFLHVVGRRADGYHLLQSAFCLIDWCDTLDLLRRDDGVISRVDLGPALPSDDLCTRAARALQAASGTRLGVEIRIDKQVPWGAGLGGGSSDAATVLIGLNRLWGLGWSRARLADLGLSLGADVPFFIGGQNAWVEGIGERLTPIDLPAHEFGLVKPAVAIPTAAIFGSPLLSRSTPAAIVADFLADTLAFGRNDLQPCAEAYSEQVGEAARLLERHVGTSRMSGSGSTVFAGRRTECAGPGPDAIGEPTGWRQVLATLPDDWIARWCRSLPDHPLRGWLDG